MRLSFLFINCAFIMQDVSNIQCVGPLKEAINWARSVHNLLPDLWEGINNGIDVHGKFLKFVSERFQLGNPSNCINIIRAEEHATNVHGCLIRKKINSNDIATIIIPINSNHCWTRFAVAKELSHVLTETHSKFWCKDVLLQLQIAAQRPGMAEGSPLPGDFSTLNLQSEHFCYFMAIELGFPWAIRRDSPSISNNGKSFLDIANEHKMPEAVLEHACKCNYFELSHEINSMLDKDPVAALT